MQSAVIVTTWHQRSKSPAQVWRCKIALPGDPGVIGRADNERDAIKDAIRQLDPDDLVPGNLTINTVPSIAQSGEREYEYNPNA